MFGSLGIMELVAIFGVALLVFGPRKLPEIGRTLGKALGEFRKATDDFKNTIEREVRLEELKSIKTVSMESFTTPLEAVSRTTPSPLAADTTVSETSPAPEAVDAPTLQSGGNSAAAATPAPMTSTTDDETPSELSSTRRLEDSTT